MRKQRVNNLNMLCRPAAMGAALLIAAAGSALATPIVQHTWSSGQDANGQAVDQRVVVRATDQNGGQRTSRTVYDVTKDGEHISVEVTSENGHTVVKLNGEVVSEFEAGDWGRFEVQNASGDVVAHVVQVPGGAVVVRPGDALSAFEAIGGIRIDPGQLQTEILRNFTPGQFSLRGNALFPEPPRVMLGINMNDLSGEEAAVFDIEQGTLITNVFEDSPAENAGLQDGDVIIQIDGVNVDSQDIREIVLSADPGKRIQVKVLRDGEVNVMPIELQPFDPGVMVWEAPPGFADPGAIWRQGPVEIETLIDRFKGQGGPRGIFRMLDEDQMREAREEVARLAQQLEFEAQRMASATESAKVDIEKRMVELANELSEHGAEMARQSAGGALRGLRLFHNRQDDSIFESDSGNLIELFTPEGPIVAAPPATPGTDARYRALEQRYEQERDARRAAEARLRELNERLARLESRLEQLLDKLSER